MIDVVLAFTFVVSIVTFTFWNLLALAPERKRTVGKLHLLSVVVPAHNEKSVIGATLKSILDAEYPERVEVVVVDDGSTDGTKDVVSDIMASDGRVRLLSTNHLGKAMAVNHGVKNCTGDVVVMLDADSILKKDALILLSEPFSDPMVGAASGIILVVENDNPLVWYQHMEYVLSSMWRYVFDKMGCSYTLPGFCSFRKEALVAAGKFSTDTLSEDFDIGLKIRKAGWKIVMSKAVMHTNVPQTLAGVAGQRMRWGRGTYQVVAKHKDMILNRRYGIIGLYGLPHQIYFFVQGMFIVPITIYQIVSGYLEYFAQYGNYLTFDAIKFFFGWMSVFGVIELSFNVFRGVWQAQWTFPYLIVAVALNYFYNLLAMVKLDKVSLRLIAVTCFFFPYYIFTLSFFIYPILLEMNPLKRRLNSHINIWEKNR